MTYVSLLSMIPLHSTHRYILQPLRCLDGRFLELTLLVHGLALHGPGNNLLAFGHPRDLSVHQLTFALFGVNLYEIRKLNYMKTKPHFDL